MAIEMELSLVASAEEFREIVVFFLLTVCNVSLTLLSHRPDCYQKREPTVHPRGSNLRALKLELLGSNAGHEIMHMANRNLRLKFTRLASFNCAFEEVDRSVLLLL